MGVRINELNTDSVAHNNVYAAFKIERSLIYQFGSINYYGQRFPVKRSFKIKSVIFNSEKGNLLENKEFTEVKKYLNKVFFDLVNKEFLFSIDEIIKK
ncbi:hypothetical protein [Spirobacillus cienkowskii]|uniref:hypothetical protein n=1 Tax=Spirobacillus cienkowskii TaxID=495820 RepID=UPI0030CAF67D